jgi:ketosteroid isomerase-like protein
MGTSSNTELVERWAELFNTDVEKLVTELYSPECRFSGASMNHEKLIRFEKRVLAAAPNRTMRVERSHELEDGVAVEGTLIDPDKGADWALTFCAVLTVVGGKIVHDNTYADFSRWPGMS